MNFAFIKKSLQRLRWQPPPNDRSILGRRGERLAARFLRKNRHKILARNFRCTAGEIDLVTLHGDTIVFVEVKTRSSADLQDILETAGAEKWLRVERAARAFLLRMRNQQYSFRFDFVAVMWPQSGKPTIEHIEDAYHAKGR